LTKDDIGERGQAMFFVVMTELCGRNEPYFRPRFLGDKFPTFDFLVELVDHPGYFFFVQVKTTTKGFTIDPPKLQVQVSQGMWTGWLDGTHQATLWESTSRIKRVICFR
jgi:hypothetical protein